MPYFAVRTSDTSSVAYGHRAVGITGSPPAGNSGSSEVCLGLSKGTVSAGAEATPNNLEFPPKYGKLC